MISSTAFRFFCVLVIAAVFASGAPFSKTTQGVGRAAAVGVVNNAIDFDGSNDRLSIGNPVVLGLSTFTIETWFRRDADGAETTTSAAGGGGLLNAIPLVTKGRGQADGSNVDMNYFLGIDNLGDVLAADFEDNATGLNHSILGRTVICNGVWYHAAATFDGTKWQLFLNGELEQEVAAAFTPRFDSLQHFGIGTAYTSTPTAAGFFAGAIDDVRVWNSARTEAQIKANLGIEIGSASGLVGSWNMNEGGGLTTVDSSGNGNTATLVNNPLWVAGTPFTVVQHAVDLVPNTYVSMGTATGLNASNFTLEGWIRRDGPGTPNATTGTGGLANVVPIIAKGRDEAESVNQDINYYFGIDSTGHLAVDFEEAAGQPSPGLNHPFTGTGTLAIGTWYHVAVTYDGSVYRLYINGNLDSLSGVIGRLPNAGSTQTVTAIGSSVRTAAGAAPLATGFFDGAMDEMRIWNYARSQAEIQAGSTTEITAATGLLGRWGFDTSCGTVVYDSDFASPINGSIVSDGPPTGSSAFVAGAPGISPELPPTVNAGPNQNVTIAAGATMAGSVSDDGLPLPVSSVWSQVSGPGTASFTNASQLNTTVNFSLTGTYVLRLTGSDGANARSDDVTITVTEVNFAVSFREGVSGYVGTIDTFLRSSQATTAQGANQELQWDTEESGANSPQFALVRFDNIFGNGAGQIPPGVFVTSATLNYTVFDAGDASDVNEAAIAWDETSTYNNFGGDAGVQADEYGAFVDSAPGNPTGTHTIDVTSSIAAWHANPSLNRGWIFRPLGTDGVDARSSEYTTSGERPLLTVTYSTVQPNRPPNTPVIVSPTDGSMNVDTSPNLVVDVSDPDGDALTVTYFGRPKSSSPAPDFTIIAVPDTQNYADGAPNGSELEFNSQLQWIAGQRVPRNIAFVTQLGDCVQNGDNGGNNVEWLRADAAWDMVEVPYAGFPHGMPYGIAVGNHDQSPNGDPNGTTTFFNQFFGEARFSGRAYYGGHYGTNNDNHYQLFSASGMDFIIIHLEYDPAANPAVLAWANGLLQANPTRRGILVSHHFVNIGNPGSFGTQGQATYNALRGNPNFFLMLNGHVHGEGRRQDTFNGNTVNSILSDYQARTNGGDGWLRIMTFKPSLNQVDVQTYSTTLAQFETDADSQFSFTYDMSGSGTPYEQIGQNTNVPGLMSQSSFTWTDRAAGSDYQWYVSVTDGEFTVTTPMAEFRTLGATAANVSVSGRVSDRTSRGLRNVSLTLSDQKGGFFTARTNSFGYFRFDDVTAGTSYLLEAQAKGRTFPARVIAVDDNIERLEVIADP